MIKSNIDESIKSNKREFPLSLTLYILLWFCNLEQNASSVSQDAFLFSLYVLCQGLRKLFNFTLSGSHKTRAPSKMPFSEQTLNSGLQYLQTPYKQVSFLPGNKKKKDGYAEIFISIFTIMFLLFLKNVLLRSGSALSQISKLRLTLLPTATGVLRRLSSKLR